MFLTKIIAKVLETDYVPQKNEVVLSKVELNRTRQKYEKGGVVVQVPLYRYTIKKFNMDSYDKIVDGLIREKYTQANVEAILANYLNDSTNETYKNEFTEFQAYRELCKNKAKEFIEERNNIL